MPAARRQSFRPRLETLEGRQLLSAGFGSVLAPDVAPIRSIVAQPTADVAIIHGAPTKAADHSVAASAVFDGTTIYSVVTLTNNTRNTINYQLAWGNGSFASYSVDPGQSRWHWATGKNVSATIRYDWSFAAGYQEQRYSLTSKDFAGGGFADLKPGKPSDGLIYTFQLNSAGSGLNLFATTPLNKSAYASERQILESAAQQQSFPNLMTNYEVMGPSTRTYNCIANSLGYHDRWVNPITGPRNAPLSGMDRLYAAEGYQRMSTLDFSLRAGYQKVVVYATLTNGAISTVTHAAIQLSDGTWSSKLGSLALIRTLTPDALDGPAYGVPVAVYIRHI